MAHFLKRIWNSRLNEATRPYRLSDVTVNLVNGKIPPNSWWSGFYLSPLNRWYLGIEFLKNITEDTEIHVDTTVQTFGFFRYEDLYHESQSLCEPITDNCGFLNLFRQMLAIPEGCPVKPMKKVVNKIWFPLRTCLNFEKDVTRKRLRILFNVWESNALTAQNLASGVLYVGT
ncbi:uncharacterized protein [Fopius arisanus]|uniref:Uncharacterized protein isoform X2 n=1 Tax=Fopius arisanus TaxID=64838 RepID=A0A9R1SYG9_9HYME|nr:PREDICTED: uncharacterized protein LOC105264282 isoform X2 [Fopius arisanus]